MPRRLRTFGRSEASPTWTVNPASRKCCTQPEQQSQFGSLWTLIMGSAATAGRTAAPSVAAAIRVRKDLRAKQSFSALRFWSVIRRLSREQEGRGVADNYYIPRSLDGPSSELSAHENLAGFGSS